MHSFTSIFTPFLIASLVTACSSSSSSSGSGKVSVTGTVDSVSLAGLDGAFAAVSTTGKGDSLIVLLTEGASCDDISAGNTSDATYLELFLAVEAGSDADSTTPTGPGTFQADPSAPGSDFVEATAQQLGSDCSEGIQDDYGSGTVTVTSLSGGVVSGSIALSSIGLGGEADTVTGTFTTASCPGLGSSEVTTSSAPCN